MDTRSVDRERLSVTAHVDERADATRVVIAAADDQARDALARLGYLPDGGVRGR